MLKMLMHADLWTAAGERAEAMLTEAGRIVYVGARQGAEARLAGRPCTREDLGGRTVLPGFNDAHLHVLGYAMGKQTAWLGAASSADEVTEMLQAHWKACGSRGGWLQGRGWNQERFPSGRYPTRADLDAVSADVPILATRVCGHVGVLNTRAMTLCGLGDADGLVREEELDAVNRRIPMPSDEEMIEALEAAQEDLFACGITSVQSDDLGYLPLARKLNFARALRDACKSGRIRVRYAQQAIVDNLEQLEDFLAAGLYLEGDERFRISTVKLLQDGSLGARTAYLRRPYADAPETRGQAMRTQEELDALVVRANGVGLPVAVHVIGDAAMEQALRAFEQVGTHPRNAVVHAQITTPDQSACCGRLGLVVMAQPIFLAADAPILEARVGRALADTSYAWKTMADAGAHVALSTDCPVEPFEPLRNLYFAMKRKAPGGAEAHREQECFDAEEAVAAYTAQGAYASGEAEEKGTLAPGRTADYVILSGAWDGDAETLRALQVSRTVLAGETVYEADATLR